METAEWRVDDEGVLFQQTHAVTTIVWPCDVEFQYSDMAFIGADGTVWVAAHVNIHEVFIQLGDDCGSLDRLELNAGREPLAIWREGIAIPLAQFDHEERASFDNFAFVLWSLSRWTEGVLPGSVAGWLAEHPILTFQG